MKVGMVALHYPRREHRDEMVSRVRQAAVRRASGNPSRPWRQGPPPCKTAGVDFGYDERESRPRKVLKLLSA